MSKGHNILDNMNVALHESRQIDFAHLMRDL